MSRSLFVAYLLVAVALAPLALAQQDSFADPNPANKEWVESVLSVHQPDLRTLNMEGSVVLRKYEVEGSRYQTSDDLAQAYQDLVEVDTRAREQAQESGRAAAFVAEIEAAVATTIRESLEAAFPEATITVAPAVLDVNTLSTPSGNPYAPGVALAVSATVVRTAEQAGLGDLTQGAIDAVFALGARIESTISVSAAAGHHVTYIFEAPGSLGFASATPAPEVRIDGSNMVIEVDNSAGTESRMVESKVIVADPSARHYTQQEIDAGSTVTAFVDLQDIDIELGKALGGDMGNLVGEVTVTTDLSVFALPAELKGTLPAGIELDTLTSNGVRILRAEGVISERQLADLETTFLAQVEASLKNSLQTSVKVTGGLVAGTLDAAGVESVEGGSPLRLAAEASFVKPLSGAPAPEAAIALYTQSQSFELPRVQGMATSYKILLPPGLAVTSLDVIGGEKSTGTENGRDWFIVSPSAGAATATVGMAVTPAFVFAKFLPIVLLAVLVVVLIIGTPIALVVAKKRKGKSR